MMFLYKTWGFVNGWIYFPLM